MALVCLGVQNLGGDCNVQVRCQGAQRRIDVSKVVPCRPPTSYVNQNQFTDKKMSTHSFSLCASARPALWEITKLSRIVFNQLLPQVLQSSTESQ